MDTERFEKAEEQLVEVRTSRTSLWLTNQLRSWKKVMMRLKYMDGEVVKFILLIEEKGCILIFLYQSNNTYSTSVSYKSGKQSQFWFVSGLSAVS